MKPHEFSLFAAAVLCFIFVAPMHAEQFPAERIAEIQAALRAAKLDGWLLRFPAQRSLSPIGF